MKHFLVCQKPVDIRNLETWNLHAPPLAVEWGSDRTEGTIGAKSRSFSRLAGDPVQGVQGGKMAHSLRSLGSAALNYALVAQGSLDLYWYVKDLFFCRC